MSNTSYPLLASGSALVALACSLTWGCAYGTEGGFGGDGGFGASGAAAGHTTTTSSSHGGTGGTGGTSTGGTGGTSTGGTGGTSTGGTGGAPADCHIVVNELQTGSNSSASDEFVELFNSCASSTNLTGYKLIYRSASGNTDVTLFSFTSGSISGNGYLLIVGSAYSGGGQTDGTFPGGGLAAAGGGVALKDAGSAIVDSVGYGTATNAFVEGQAAPAPDKDQSVGRSPNGKDTGNNAADFVTFALPTPRAHNG
jgi:hypothetical protein